MVRKMCGVHFKSRTVSAEFNSRLGIECITDVLRRSRLPWLGHAKRTDSDECISACRSLKLIE